MSFSLPVELRTLLSTRSSLDHQIALHQSLLSQLDSLLAARKQGHNTMHLPVDLGMGYTLEGVVENTDTIHLKTLEERFVELPIDQAPSFVQANLEVLTRRKKETEDRIEQATKDVQGVKEALKKVLSLPDDDEIEKGKGKAVTL